MSFASRREFILGGAALGAYGQGSPNERINVAVVGIHGRGRAHYAEFVKMPNVNVAALCDVDERLFPDAVSTVERASGRRPKTYVDIRKLLEDKEIDAVSIATPDHWHALMTVWGCQAGKDVYVEKPASYTIVEGRRMVEAARKYNRIVQVGHNRRSDGKTIAAMRLLHEGKLGSVYRAKTIIEKPRGDIGTVQESSIPQGVHWDLYLGPAPFVPFNLNRFHYGWHFFWDTSTTDVGNTGVHSVDAARWGLNKRVHPVKVHSAGGVFAWENDQQTPNVQNAVFEYADGTLLEVELSNLYTPRRREDMTFYTTRGYLTEEGEWKSGLGNFGQRAGRPEISSAGVNDRATNISFPNVTYSPGPPVENQLSPNHFENFIECVRSRKVESLHCDILEGHMSAALCHMANISYRTGRKLVFDPKTETFGNDAEANRYLTRKYREPYALPDKV